MSGIDFDEVEFTTESDLDEAELEALLESGDEEAVEALLSGKPVSPAATSEPDDGGKQQEQAATTDEDSELAALIAQDEDDADPDKQEPTAKQDEKENGTPSDADAEGEGEPGQRKVVKSKDGTHEIPYEVLEATRKQLREEREAREADRLERERLQAETAQLKELESVNQKLREQLESNNIKPGDLPDEIDMSPERIAQLKDDYGELGDVIEAMLNQNRQLRDQITTKGDTPAAPAANPEAEAAAAVDAAIGRNADLAAWGQRDANGDVADPDRWTYAVNQDIQLREDPAFKGKSYDERFAEVARRTRAAFGDPEPGQQKESEQSLADKAAARIKEAESKQHPQTLSDVGRPAVTEKSLSEQFEDMEEGEMLARMEGMTPEQIDNLIGL